MVVPRYIFRGITQRYFTSSEQIRERLRADESFFNAVIKDSHKKFIYSNKNDFTEDNWLELEKAAYEFCRKSLNKYIGKNGMSTPAKADKLMDDLVFDTASSEYSNPHNLYFLVKPRYIRSGAAVRLYTQQNRTQNDYIYYLRNLISELKSRHPAEYKGFSDLEILAEIQHNGGATCLVDFSTNFLNALWFATQDYASSDEQIGYLYCYDTNTDAIERNNLMFLNATKERKTIEELVEETQRMVDYQGQFSCRFMLWKPSNINTRIARQDSVFIFGIEKFSLCEHPVYVLPIPPKWKRAIQASLKDFFGLCGETLYDDATGVSTANTKTCPLKPQTDYFLTSYINGNPRVKYDYMNLFQQGTSTMLKGQYSIALDYFTSFEGSNYIKLNADENSALVDGELQNSLKVRIMLDVEMNYSKAICHRHLNNSLDAIIAYKKAIKMVKIILSHSDEKDLSQKCEDYICQHDDKYLLERYAFNKLFKILRDYIALLYDLKEYSMIDKELNAIIEWGQINRFNWSDSIRLFYYTICNETRILRYLRNGKSDAAVDLIEINTLSDISLFPLCGLLDKYFKAILNVINNSLTLDDVKTIADNVNQAHTLKITGIQDIVSYLSKLSAIVTNVKIYNRRVSGVSYLFTDWLLKDIKDAVNGQPNRTIVDPILYLTTCLENCQRLLNGRKRQEVY